MDAAIKTIGFNPARVAREGRSARKDMQDVQSARTIESEIAEKLAHGVFAQDKTMVEDARDELAPIVISTRQIMQRVQSMLMSRRARLIKATPKELRGLVAGG